MTAGSRPTLEAVEERGARSLNLASAAPHLVGPTPCFRSRALEFAKAVLCTSASLVASATLGASMALCAVAPWTSLAHAGPREGTPSPLRPFHQMSEAEMGATLRRIHERNPSFGARVAAISGRFLSTPYKFNPLGEGPGSRLDPDPTFSVQQVDCLTFIEEVLALAHSPDLAVAKQLLQRIRYAGGKVAYATRHHFAESQWLPANQKLGVVREITHDIGGDAVVTQTKRLSPATFVNRWAKWKKHLGPQLPLGEFALPVLPIVDALRLWKKFPAGAIVTVVRVDRKDVPTRITHQGIVVLKGGKRYLRHASGPPFKRVIDFSLDAYFRFCIRYFKHRWPVFGVNVQLLSESEALRGEPANSAAADSE